MLTEIRYINDKNKNLYTYWILENIHHTKRLFQMVLFVMLNVILYFITNMNKYLLILDIDPI